MKKTGHQDGHKADLPYKKYIDQAGGKISIRGSRTRIVSFRKPREQERGTGEKSTGNSHRDGKENGRGTQGTGISTGKGAARTGAGATEQEQGLHGCREQE